MNYEIGSVAELISGLRTPNRERAICRAATPRKKPQEEPITPQESPMPRIRVPKKTLDSFDSPKSVPKKRALKLADNFRFLSQMSDDDEPVNSSCWNSDEFVREYYEDKNGIRKIIKGGKQQKKPNSIREVTDSDLQLDEDEPIPSKKSKKKNKGKIPDPEFDFNNADHQIDYNESISSSKKSKKKNKDKIPNPEFDNANNQIDENEPISSSKKSKKKNKQRKLNLDFDVADADQLEDDSISNLVIKKSKKKNREKKSEYEDSVTGLKKFKRKHCDSSEKENEHTEETVSQKKSKKMKSGDSFNFEKTIAKQKKKSKHSNDTETLPVESESIYENEEGENEELTDFQKAAQRRIELKAKRDLKYEPDETNRTIFIGNIPVSVLKGKYKKTLRGIFSKYGEIDSIRVRNVPVEDIKTKPKVAFIEKKFHPERTTASAYIKFKDPSTAKKALVENNSLLEGNHLRVDSCDNKKYQTDSRKTLFLGNLPFNIEEETVREVFNKCGSIQYIRLIRDRKTQIGKGFGFVNFEKAEGVEFALMMTEDDLKINGKTIRIKRYNTHPNNDSYRPDNNKINENSKNPKAKYSEKAILNSKKRDSHGNKIRKRDLLGEKKKKVKAILEDVNEETENKNNDGEENEDVSTKQSKSTNYESFKGLIAKKKKKNKINKGVLKKKKISKMLMQKL